MILYIIDDMTNKNVFCIPVPLYVLVYCIFLILLNFIHSLVFQLYKIFLLTTQLGAYTNTCLYSVDILEIYQILTKKQKLL